MLRVAHERQRFADGVQIGRHDAARTHGVPERIERQFSVLHPAVGSMVERDAQPLHLPSVGSGNPELRPGPPLRLRHLLLHGQRHEAVLARREIEMHTVVLRPERCGTGGVRLAPGGHEVAVGVEDIDRNAAHVIGEHIGTLKIVVVTEIQIHAAVASATILVNPVGTRHATHEQAAAQQRPAV